MIQHPIISYPQKAHSLTRKIEDFSFWYQHRNEILLRIANKYITPASTVYDLGGGNGIVTQKLEQAGYNCILVEAMPEAVAIARERNIFQTLQIPIQEFTLENLDTILLLDVLEHIENDTKIIQQLRKQISDNGTLIITVPAFNHLQTDIDKEIGHFRRYTLRSLTKLLVENGYTVQYRSYFFSLLYIPFLLFRVLPFKIGLRKTNTEKRRGQEHFAGKKRLNLFLKKLFHWECYCIKNKIPVPLGTSCIIVATPKQTLP